MMHVTVTGATGLVGSRLVARLLERGDRVTVLSRNAERARQKLGDVQSLTWNPSSSDPVADEELVRAVEGRDAVVNLAGEPIFQRWSDEAKDRIRASRLQATDRLVRALGATTTRPTVLVSGSASGYYGDTGAIEVEEGHAPADDFLALLARDWEQEALRAEDHGLRVVLVRSGMILGADGGALPVMAKPIRFGAGAWMGSGRQYVPWVHLEDEVGLILAALDAPDFRGPINAAAPGSVTNKQLTQAIGRTLHRPVLLGAPAPVLRLALGERAMLVLDSCRMVPGRAPELHYRFAHPGIHGALDDLLGSSG